MSDVYLGQIEAFAFGYAPRGWQQCNGQLLSIQQNAALFALLGTSYGGNGTTTFALPDLRGRVAVAFGQSSAGSLYVQGEATGTENVTLLESNMPAGPHTHALNVNTATSGGTPTPSNSAVLSSGYKLQGTTATAVNIYTTATPTVPMATLTPVGGQPHTNMAPILAINYCISMSGVFPSRG